MAATGLRSVRLPLEHLNSELLAAPLASPISFLEPLDDLDPTVHGKSGALWRNEELNLIRTFPGISLDELLLRRDAIWFGDPGFEKRIRLHEFLTVATKHFFDASSSYSLVGQVGRSEKELRREWKWVRFALPTDLLLVAMGRSSEPDELVSSSLRRRLSDKGYAEAHLHLKAAIDFPMLWESLQNVLYSEAKEHMFVGPGADFDEGREFADWLVRVAIIRLLLAGFLKEKRQYASFQGYLQNALTTISLNLPASTVFVIGSVIGEMSSGCLSRRFNFSSVLDSYRQLTRGFWRRGGPYDPMSRSYGKTGSMGYEFAFMQDAFAYLNKNSGDFHFERLFWQCQRIRVRFYRHIVQRPMTPGLQFFTRTYARLSAPRKAIQTDEFVESAIRLSGRGIRSLEARLVPDNTVYENLAMVKKFHDALKEPSIEAGLVFHFSKSRGREYEKGRPAAWGASGNENPINNAGRYRFGNFYRNCRRQALALSGLIRSNPNVLARLRGIDYCTDELGVPTWVLKPAFEHVRFAASGASAHLRALGTRMDPIRTTVHAGEDFAHLMGGIRRIDEAIEFLRLGDGDRLGHALALGIDTDKWAESVSSVPVTRSERLFDLIWARRRILKDGSRNLASHLSVIDNELSYLAKAVFDQAIQVQDLNLMFEQLHESMALQSVGFPDLGVIPEALPPSLTLLHRWLTDQAVYNRSVAIHCVETANEVRLVDDLQNLVREQVGSKGIVIEVNPTSNLLIGNLSDTTEHPLWRLSSPDPAKRGNSLRVCIGSDDPITFATNLQEEYQLLADAIVSAGFSAQDSDRWIEEARETGMNSRFTFAHSKVNLCDTVIPPIPTRPMIP